MKQLRILMLYLPYIFQTIWFNFHYLPFKQAIKLPILLYKPKLNNCKGFIRIDSQNINTGMIKLGVNMVSVYPNSGVMIQVGGGIIFKGKCNIGNNSFISVGSTGIVTFGEDFIATSSLKLICYKEIDFGNNVLVGWENLFCDTDFHAIKLYSSNEKLVAYAPIQIGNNNWFAMKSCVLKGTRTPNNCIIGANSFLSKDYSALNEYCMLGGHPAVLIKENVYRDSNDDIVDYC